MFVAVYPSASGADSVYYYRAAIGDTINDSTNHSIYIINTHNNYRVSILTDGTIAVSGCYSSMCPGYSVNLLHRSSVKLVYSEWNTSLSAQLMKMVSVEGYVYITLGEERTSDTILHVLSTATDTEGQMLWRQTGSYYFKEFVQITLTQSNPSAKWRNVIMLSASLVCVCLLAAALALLFLKCSKQNEDTYTATNTDFVVSYGLNRGSMWSSMPTISQSVTATPPLPADRSQVTRAEHW